MLLQAKEELIGHGWDQSVPDYLLTAPTGEAAAAAAASPADQGTFHVQEQITA